MNRTKHAHGGTTVFSTWQLRRAFTHFNAELSACPSKYIIKVFKKNVFILSSFYTLQTVPLR